MTWYVASLSASLQLELAMQEFKVSSLSPVQKSE
jgi:hypothetical protein